jgi:hypothetical protein
VIYKYSLSVDTELELPVGARILCVQVQHEVPCVWVWLPEVLTPPEKRRIVVIGTGQPMPSGKATYIGTFQLADGQFVGHTFELEAHDNSATRLATQ